MNKLYEHPPVTDDSADAPGGANEYPVATRPAALVAILVAASIAISALFVISAGTANVAAAPGDETTTPHIPYFPSQYTNQASEPSPVPATF